MTTCTGVRRIRIITLMAGIAVACNRDVRTYKRINDAVIKNRRSPSHFAMAKFTIRWKLSGSMVWVGNLVIIRQMTTRTGIRRIGIAPFVAGRTIGSDGGMRTI